MGDHSYQFYECNNPDCRLRFPGIKGFPRWNRCPACRSGIHLVAEVNNSQDENISAGWSQFWQVEALLDNIRSAWNVGSIFRTADGAGINKLYLCGITPSPDNPKVNKTSLGAEKSIHWEKYNNGVTLASQLKAKRYQLWALEDTERSMALFETPISSLDMPMVLIVGNELSGVDPGILDLCDHVVAIPMMGNKRSYNVAVAFGIAAGFLLYRQMVSHGSRSILPIT